MKQGDYQVNHVEDSQAIGPSEFPNMLEPDMKLEMSIILRQRIAGQKTCPRCGHMNSRVAEHMNWIEWWVASSLHAADH